MLNRRDAIRAVFGSLASLPIFAFMSKAEATPQITNDRLLDLARHHKPDQSWFEGTSEPEGLSGYVIAENDKVALGNAFACETLSDFREAGMTLLPDATRITVFMGENAYVVLDGLGTGKPLHFGNKQFVIFGAS